MAEEAQQIRSRIQALTWVPGSEAAVAALRTERGSDGRRLVGKRALKPYRRTGTGLEKARLWDQKRAVGYDARMVHILYGLLRGLPYARIEPGCQTYFPAYHIEQELKKLGLDLSTKQIVAWSEEGTPLPLPTREAA